MCCFFMPYTQDKAGLKFVTKWTTLSRDNRYCLLQSETHHEKYLFCDTMFMRHWESRWEKVKGLGRDMGWGIFIPLRIFSLVSSIQGNTPCPQKKFEVCFLAISQLLLGQIQKVRSVLKTTGSENFKTVLTFEIWPSWSWDNWG